MSGLNHFTKTKAFLLVLLLLCFVPSVFADNLTKAGPSEKAFSASLAKHTALIKVKYKPFDRAIHGFASDTAVKEKRLVGTDFSVPDREFEYFKAFFDGKEIAIDKKWYTDLYNPNFADGFFRIAIGDDLKSLFVFMNGASAAGHYDALWVFRQDGNHSRFVTRVSDMSPFSPDIDGIIKETKRALVK